MATTKKPVKAVALVQDVKPKRDRALIMAELCEHLRSGASLERSCKLVSDAPTPAGVLLWIEKYPDTLGKEYADARAIGYRLLADEIMAISDEACVEVKHDGEDVKLVLDATAVARNRLRVDTRKWMLSKMLPKVYGDKSTTELTGANGGPIQLANASLKSLSDDELATMQALLAKSIGNGGV